MDESAKAHASAVMTAMYQITVHCRSVAETTVFVTWLRWYVSSPESVRVWGVTVCERMKAVVEDKFLVHLGRLRADRRFGIRSYGNSSTSATEGEHALMKRGSRGYVPTGDVNVFIRHCVENEALRAQTKRQVCSHAWSNTPVHTVTACSAHYTPYAEGLRQSQEWQHSRYDVLQTTPLSFLVCLKDFGEHSDLDAAKYPGFPNPLPCLVRVETVKFCGNRVVCTCGHWVTWGIKCRCVYAVQLALGFGEAVGTSFS